MTFEPITQDEWSQIFPLYKQALFEHIDAVFGWSDTFQYQRLEQEYERSWFHWLYHKDLKVGLICFKAVPSAIHLHLLLVLPEHQKQGLGELAMQEFQNLAVRSHKGVITLSSFAHNTSAIRFYQRLGYHETDKDADFISMQKLLVG